MKAKGTRAHSQGTDQAVVIGTPRQIKDPLVKTSGLTIAETVGSASGIFYDCQRLEGEASVSMERSIAESHNMTRVRSNITTEVHSNIPSRLDNNESCWPSHCPSSTVALAKKAVVAPPCVDSNNETSSGSCRFRPANNEESPLAVVGVDDEAIVDTITSIAEAIPDTDVYNNESVGWNPVHDSDSVEEIDPSDDDGPENCNATTDRHRDLAKLFRGHGNLLAGLGITSSIGDESRGSFDVPRTNSSEFLQSIGQNDSIPCEGAEEIDSDVEVLEEVEEGDVVERRESNQSFEDQMFENDENERSFNVYGSRQLVREQRGVVFGGREYSREHQVVGTGEQFEEVGSEIIDGDDDEYEEVYEEIDEDENEYQQQHDVQSGQFQQYQNVVARQQEESCEAVRDDAQEMGNDDDDDIEIECIMEAPSHQRPVAPPIEVGPPMVHVQPQSKHRQFSRRPTRRNPIRRYQPTATANYLPGNASQDKPSNGGTGPRIVHFQRRTADHQRRTRGQSRSSEYKSENEYADLNAPFQVQGRILASRERANVVNKNRRGCDAFVGRASSRGVVGGAGQASVGHTLAASKRRTGRGITRNAGPSATMSRNLEREPSVPGQSTAVEGQPTADSAPIGGMDDTVAGTSDSGRFPRENARVDMPSLLHCIDPDCTKAFSSSAELHVHLEKHHWFNTDFDPLATLEPPLNAPKVFNCEFCSQAFKTKTGLKNHMSMHTGYYRFYCEKCQTGFNSKEKYEKDQNRHAGKGVICLKCKKKFLQQKELDKHVNACPGEPPKEPEKLEEKTDEGTAKCSKCNKIFLQHSELDQHVAKCTVKEKSL